jgi:hypothetical protein
MFPARLLWKNRFQTPRSRLTFRYARHANHEHAEMRNGAELKWTGSEYSGPIQIMMSGGWNVSLEARRGSDVLATLQTHVNAR